MLSIDTNILLYAYSSSAPEHGAARGFLLEHSAREDVVLSEFVLTELYVLLRNPSVFENPLSAAGAVEVIQGYRAHPRWQIVGFPPDSRAFHDRLWPQIAAGETARRAVFDLRLALSLRAFGTREFATANVRDFQHLGFSHVWNPLTEDPE